MLSSQIKSNEIVFGSCNKVLLEEIIFYGIGLGADFVEIFIENTDNSSVLAEEDFITSVSPSFGRGAGIRIFKGKKDGFVSTNDLSLTFITTGKTLAAVSFVLLITNWS